MQNELIYKTYFFANSLIDGKQKKYASRKKLRY